MREIENIVIGKSAVPSLIITVILMVGIPVIFSSIGVRTIINRQIFVEEKVYGYNI